MSLVGLLVFSYFIGAYSEHSWADRVNISEPYLLKAIVDNETVDYAYDNSDEDQCEPLKPMTLNCPFPVCRISQKKCFEYIAMVENKIREKTWNDICNLNTRIKLDYKKKIEEIPIILGGKPAVIDDFPHMAAIGWKAKNPSVEWVFKCGSSLISEKFLLTAAHCSKVSLSRVSDVIQRQPEIVRLGVTNILVDEVKRKFTDMKIKRFILHPKYAAPAKYYDIALIELFEEVNFIRSLHPACLWPNQEFIELGNEAMITGWGYTDNGHPSEVLQVATVPVLETSLCEEHLKSNHNRNWHGFRSHQICAGNLTGGVDTCQGDSGGPIQIKMPLETVGKMYWILGVTSFGIKCGHTNRPGIYTRVASFIDWIEEIVW